MMIEKRDGKCGKRDAKKHLPSSIMHPAFSAPTKNDVLIGPEYAVWSPGQDPLVSNGLNFYYSDVPADGGYNHFELRRHKRAYTLPGVFTAGQVAPPMGQAATWLEFQVFL